MKLVRITWSGQEKVLLEYGDGTIEPINDAWREGCHFCGADRDWLQFIAKEQGSLMASLQTKIIGLCQSSIGGQRFYVCRCCLSKKVVSGDNIDKLVAFWICHGLGSLSPKSIVVQAVISGIEAIYPQDGSRE